MDVPGEAAHPVVQEDHLRVEGLDQVVQGFQGRNLPAGGDVDVDSEGGNATRLVSLRIRVGAEVALVQMGEPDTALCFGYHRTLGDEDRYARTHWVIVLGGDVEDAGANDVCHALEDTLQPLRVVHLVDVGEILFAVRPALGVADVVYVETQALGQVIEPTEPESLPAYSHVSPPSRSTRPVLRSYPHVACAMRPAVAKPSLAHAPAIPTTTASVEKMPPPTMPHTYGHRPCPDKAELGVRLIHVNGLPHSKVLYNVKHERREVTSSPAPS